MSDIQNDKLQFTCLYDRHVALGAKMSPFAGFMMPIQYDSITVEHNAVRQKVGVFDVSHMGEIFISGKDAEKFVNHIFTNEIRGFEPGKVLYGMMCYPDGGVVDDLLVYRESEPDHFLLVVNAANIDKDFAWIKENIEGFDCKAVNASSSWGQVAIQGPDAEKVVTDVLGFPKAAELGFYTFYDDEWKGSRLIISRTGYTGEDGFELYTTNEGTCEIWDILMKAGVQPCGLGCRDTLRFEAGLPLYGDELSDKISPVVAGLGMLATTAAFYKLMSKATKIDMSRASDFKLMDRKAVDTLLEMPERNAFFRAMSSWIGFQSTTVEFDVQEREAGESKWSTKSLIKYAITNIVGYSSAPMQIVTGAGVVVFLLGVILGIQTLVRYFSGHAVEGFTTVILLILIIGSIIMISLGIIGYYISRIYEEVKGRPRYIISKKV